jgi:hypothetical protein
LKSTLFRILLTISGYNPGAKTTYLSHNEPLASIWGGNFQFSRHSGRVYTAPRRIHR